jgi:hypothetical protein
MRFGCFRAVAGGKKAGGRRLATPPPKQETPDRQNATNGPVSLPILALPITVYTLRP